MYPAAEVEKTLALVIKLFEDWLITRFDSAADIQVQFVCKNLLTLRWPEESSNLKKFMTPSLQNVKTEQINATLRVSFIFFVFSNIAKVQYIF